MARAFDTHSTIRVAIHGPTAACHELHGEPPGSFAAAMDALSRARVEGRPVLVASWLTRSSCRSLVGLVERLVGYGVAGWAIAWPRACDVDAAAVPRTVPRLGIAVPHALRAVQRATQRGLPTVLVGIPSCVLGPFAGQAWPRAEAGAHAAPCEGCPARAGCAGVDPWYAERFGGGELRAVAAVPRATVRDGLGPALVAAVAELRRIA